MISSVIQGTGMEEFKDGLWIGNQLKAQNGLQLICNIPRVLPGSVCSARFFERHSEFHFDKVCLVLSKATGLIPGSRGVRI